MRKRYHETHRYIITTMNSLILTHMDGCFPSFHPQIIKTEKKNKMKSKKTKIIGRLKSSDYFAHLLSHIHHHSVSSFSNNDAVFFGI